MIRDSVSELVQKEQLFVVIPKQFLREGVTDTFIVIEAKRGIREEEEGSGRSAVVLNAIHFSDGEDE